VSIFSYKNTPLCITLHTQVQECCWDLKNSASRKISRKFVSWNSAEKNVASRIFSRILYSASQNWIKNSAEGLLTILIHSTVVLCFAEDFCRWINQRDYNALDVGLFSAESPVVATCIRIPKKTPKRSPDAGPVRESGRSWADVRNKWVERQMALTTMTTAIPRQWSRFSLSEKKRREKLSLIDSQRELREKTFIYIGRRKGACLCCTMPVIPTRNQTNIALFHCM